MSTADRLLPASQEPELCVPPGDGRGEDEDPRDLTARLENEPISATRAGADVASLCHGHGLIQTKPLQREQDEKDGTAT